MVLKSGILCDIFGANVQSPTLPVEAVRFAALFCESWSCLSIIFWTPSGKSKSAFLLIISYNIFSLLSIFFLLILSSRLTSQYQGMGLATNLYSSEEKSQCISVDFGIISLSETWTWLIISSLNRSSLYFLSLYWSFSIFSYRLSLTNEGTYLDLNGCMDSISLRYFSSSISWSFCYRMETFFCLSLVSKAKGIGIVTLNFLSCEKVLELLICSILSCLRFILFCLTFSLNSSSLEDS